MRTTIMTALALAIALPMAPVLADPPPWSHAGGNKQKKDKDARQDNRHEDYSRYDYNRPDPRYQSYQANRYYVADSRYQPRRLGPDDRIYRG